MRSGHTASPSHCNKSHCRSSMKFGEKGESEKKRKVGTKKKIYSSFASTAKYDPSSSRASVNPFVRLLLVLYCSQRRVDLFGPFELRLPFWAPFAYPMMMGEFISPSGLRAAGLATGPGANPRTDGGIGSRLTPCRSLVPHLPVLANSRLP